MFKRNLLHWALPIFCLAAALTAQAAPGIPESPRSQTAPTIFLPSGEKGTSEYVIVVEKGTQTLYLYRYDGVPHKVLEMPCSTGKNPGPKQASGDSRTPEGVYFFNKRHEDKYLAPIYGIRAFPTDYPNLMDRMQKRTGNAIWLHGTNKDLVPMDSNGCIVVENANIDQLTGYIELHRTPIVVVEKLTFKPWAERRITAAPLRNLISNWLTALERDSYHKYLAFYSADFVPDITWWAEWLELRRDAADLESPVSLELENFYLFDQGDLYVAVFDQYLVSGDRREWAGLKKLYLSDAAGRLEIVAENYQYMPRPDDAPHPVLLARLLLQDSQAALLASAAPAGEPESADPAPPPPAADPQQLDRMVTDWLKAWSEQDIKTYGSFYARDFRAQGMDKAAWLDYKDRLNKKYTFIRVGKSDLAAEARGNQMVVSFTQRYESNAFRTRGKKQLILKREDGKWKIYRENYQKL